MFKPLREAEVGVCVCMCVCVCVWFTSPSPSSQPALRSRKKRDGVCGPALGRGLGRSDRATRPAGALPGTFHPRAPRSPAPLVGPMRETSFGAAGWVPGPGEVMLALLVQLLSPASVSCSANTGSVTGRHTGVRVLRPICARSVPRLCVRGVRCAVTPGP